MILLTAKIGPVGVTHKMIDIISMRLRADDGTEGTVVSMSHKGMMKVLWDERRDWCYPDYDEAVTFEHLDDCYFTHPTEVNNVR